ncbi:MAG: DUF4249 domain-containing protein [Chryseolinea sp.]
MKRFILMLCLLLSGCDLVVDIDIPLKNPSLVVNLVFDPQNKWSAYVGRNNQVLDTAVVRVANALVVIYAGGQSVDTLTYLDHGYYGSDDYPALEVDYEVRVSAPDFADVTANSFAPVPAQITSVSIGPEVSDKGKSFTNVKIVFKDDPATENFYELTLETVDDNMDSNGNIIQETRPIAMTTDDPLSTTGQSDEVFALQFKDVLFNGKENSYSFTAISGQLNYAKSVILRLRTISKDLYLYRTTTIAQGLASDNRFAQPVNVYNNIHNGFGIFAGAASSVYVDTKPTPYITSVSPDHGKAGDVILISGGNFIYGEQSSVSVLFYSDSNPHGISSRRLRPTADVIEAVVPEGASTGKIRVDAIGGIVFSPDEFFIDE